MIEAFAPASALSLGVRASVTGRIWRPRVTDEGLIARLRQQLGISDLLARIMAGRGVAIEQAEHWLNPSLKYLFPNPSDFTDMDRAVELVFDILQAGTPTAVFADYDVDGATAAATLVRTFRAFGRELQIYVPDRLAEGYGPSPEAFARLKVRGVEQVITVDCGAAAFDALEAAHEMGLKVIVFDHHLMHGTRPHAAALVNPNRPDDQSGCGYMAAAGVVLVFVAALNRLVKQRGGLNGSPGIDPMQFLDLSALGTICDVAPLIGANRAIVAKGLRRMESEPTMGLRQLAHVAGLETPKSAYHAGFMLGPRLNAGGRVGQAWLATTLLSTDDPDEALQIAQQLHALNDDRKAIELEMLEQAVAQVEASLRQTPDLPVAFAAREGWHPGVIGIVAGRLKERFHRPSFVVGWGAGFGPAAKGSGRSVEGVNLGACVAEAALKGAILSGGGHAMAAGASLHPHQIEAFRQHLASGLKADAETMDEARTLRVDALLSLSAASSATFAEIEQAAPYGAGSPEPLLVFADVKAIAPRRVGEYHLRFVAQDRDGERVDTIAFRAVGQPLGELIESGSAFHLAGRLSFNTWNGKTKAQIDVVDAARVLA